MIVYTENVIFRPKNTQTNKKSGIYIILLYTCVQVGRAFSVQYTLSNSAAKPPLYFVCFFPFHHSGMTSFLVHYKPFSASVARSDTVIVMLHPQASKPLYLNLTALYICFSPAEYRLNIAGGPKRPTASHIIWVCINHIFIPFRFQGKFD